MTNLLNQQLFAEVYLRDTREVRSSVDVADACRMTIREWRDEYPALESSTELLAYLPQCFSTLGFSYERHDDPSHFLLYSDETHARPLGICLPVSDDQLGRTNKGQHYHAQLIGLLRARQLTWGIVTNGRSWRLCHAKASAPYEVYLEADLDALLDPSRLADFLLFYRFFSREAFEFETEQNGRAPRQGLDRMLSESEKRTQAIERLLKGRVDDLLQSLCLGFVEDEAAMSYNREKLDEIYRNAIYLLYRILFLFYAEARHLLPMWHSGYQSVSLAGIVEDARRRQREGVQNSDPYSLWKRLTRLFVIVDDGDETVGVRPYNGGLFSDTEKPYLLSHKMSDDYLAPALFDLGFVETKNSPQPIDYRDLSVRHLGTLYEGLLEYRLNRVDTEPMVVRESGGKRVYLKQSTAGTIKKGETILEVGKVYFADDKGERKSSGSYYTPEDVVQYIVTNTVLTKLQEVRTTLDTTLAEALREREIAASAEERDRIERYADQQLLDLVNEKILRLHILDPAMGSGHFLVAAGQVITNFIVETLGATPWPNDMIDSAPLIWKRRVVERCLYGVDLNPLALELAKLSLWITSASEGKPLTFLDHHLRMGNSLYGTPLARLENLPSVKQAKEDSLFKLLRETVIDSILKELADITGVDSDTIKTVKQKGEAFNQAEAKATRLRDVANVWLASLFGLPGSDGKRLNDKEYASILDDLQVEYAPESWERRVANDNMLSAARTIARDEKFFHWELEFADVVVDGECRFDVIVANPPYVGTKANEAISRLFETAKCGDLYGWLFERTVKVVSDSGNIGIVVPLSIMFSSSFSSLRQLLLAKKLNLHLSCFDNIPDQIFNGGKFSDNTSKDNKQRTTIVISKSAPDIRYIRTTDLLRWSHTDRDVLFDNLRFADVMDLCSSSSFPKIGSEAMADFWRSIKSTKRSIATFCKEMFSESRRPAEGEIFLTVPRACYNFISATPGSLPRNKVLSFSFYNEKDMKLAQVLLNSNIFYWYWRVFGDGFCLSIDQVGGFPVPLPNDDGYVNLANKLDSVQDSCRSYKVIRGEKIPSYNFNKRTDVLLELDEWIIRQFSPNVDLPRDAFAQCKSTSFLRSLDLSMLLDSGESEIEE